MADNKILNNDIVEVTGAIAHGELRIGTHAVHSGYTGLWNTEASTTTTAQYLIISAGTDTYVNGDSVYLRPGNNSSTNELRVQTTGVTIGGNTVWHAGNLTPLAIGTTATTAMAGNTLSAQDITDIGNLSGTNTGDQVLPTLSSLGGASSGYLTNTGGAKLEIQNGQDGGASKGIYMWQTSDPNWGIYMAQAGDEKALNDGTASAGIDGATAHAIRFRVNDNSSQAGFIWENSSNETVMQLNGGSEKLYTKNSIYPSNQTTDYVDSTRIQNWQTAYGWGDHGLSTQDKTDIGNLSGTNTGDQTFATLGAATRTNYTLKFKPPTGSYAGFQFLGTDSQNAGYFLVRGTSDNDVYGAEGITLVGDQGWLTLAHRYSTDKGIRFMTGDSSTSLRMTIASDGDININNSLTVGSDLGVNGFIKDSLYKHAGSTNWRTKKYVRSVGITGGDIADSWVQLSRVVISSTYEKVTIKFTINGYDDVSSGVEAIDVRYENGSAAQENHQCAWYSTDDHANLFKNVRSIRSASNGLSNTYDLYVQMAGDWRDNFTVVAEEWTTHGDNASIAYTTAAGSATEPSAGSNDIERGERRWYTENSFMYLGSGRVYTTGDFTNNSSNWDTAYTDRNKWDGGSTGLTASTGRTSLGLGTAATAATTDFATASHTHAASDITSGTLAIARIPTVDSKISEFIENKHIYQRAGSIGVYMPMVKGGLYATSSSSKTGKLKIKLPSYKTAMMISFRIDVYEYNTDRQQSYIVSGYAYNDTAATWYNTSAICLSDSDNRNLVVRFYSDTTAGEQYVTIGETNSDWVYPQVVIRDVFGGYNTSISELNGTWGISFIEDEAGTSHAAHSDNSPIVQASRVVGELTTSNIPQLAYTSLSGLPTLGTAAAAATGDFATAAQGTKADSALQSETFSSSDVVLSLSGDDVTAGESITLAGGLSYSGTTLTSANDNTTYTAGTGLTLTGTSFSVTTNTYATAAQGTTADAALPKAGGTMTGNLTVSSGTNGDSTIIIESDTDNSNENDNPQLHFKQDGGLVNAYAGLVGDEGNIFTDSYTNAAYFGVTNDVPLQLFTNSTSRLTINGNGTINLEAYGAGILKTNANGLISLDTNTYSTATGVANNADVTPSWIPANDPSYLTSVPSEYLTQTEGDTRYVSFENANRAVPSTGGWRKLLKINRGGARVAISYTGGSFTPTTYVVDAYKDWSSSGTLSVQVFGQAAWIDGFRIIQEAGGGNGDFYLQANFKNISNSHSFECYYQELIGYDSISEIFAVSSGSTLPASNSSGKTAIESINVTDNQEGLYVRNLDVNGRLYLDTVDTSTALTDALVLTSGGEVEKRALGSNAFNSTTFLTAETFSATDAVMSIDGNDLTAGVSVSLAGGLTYNASTNTLTQADNDTVYTHPTTAGNKHIPAGGSSGQFLRYSSDGTAVWATPSYTTNTNTTYSAGGGLDLTGTTFSVEPDLRDGITLIGKNGSNYIAIDHEDNNCIDFYISGVWIARMEADGDLHMKGDVIAFSDIFNP